jgi:ceramide glucosyltransferase
MSLLAPLLVILATGWILLAAQVVVAMRFARRRPPPLPDAPPPVSILKPLHGSEPGLYDNLRSFAEQDYPSVQLVLGVTDPEDGALAAARALIRDLPSADIALVIDRRIRGSNGKVSNLENMLPSATHDVLVLADSDMRVDRRYLAAVTARLRDPRVGIATCLYTGATTGGLWSDLGALQINFGFLPNALLAEAMGVGGGCFGATIALRRVTLERIGGLAPLRDELADDRRMGERVRAQGFTVALAPYLVEDRVWEPSLAALWRHEQRWARTVQRMSPAGFAGSVMTHPLAIAFLAAAGSGLRASACVLFGVTLVIRAANAGLLIRTLRLPHGRLWLLPLRDLLSFAVFVASFFGCRVLWRDQNFDVAADGHMTFVDGEKSL